MKRSPGAKPTDIEALYRRRFRAFLLSVTAILGDGDAALDVVQDAFASALRRRRTFRGEGPLEAWLWRIVLNAARDRGRTMQREAHPRVADAATNGASPDAEHDLRAYLLVLPERQRLAVFLRHYADLSYDQIGDALGISAGTVGAALNAAHCTLRRQLEEARNERS